jgi:hypothetical protein
MAGCISQIHSAREIARQVTAPTKSRPRYPSFIYTPGADSTLKVIIAYSY